MLVNAVYKVSSNDSIDRYSTRYTGVQKSYLSLHVKCIHTGRLRWCDGLLLILLRLLIVGNCRRVGIGRVHRRRRRVLRRLWTLNYLMSWRRHHWIIHVGA